MQHWKLELVLQLNDFNHCDQLSYLPTWYLIFPNLFNRIIFFHQWCFLCILAFITQQVCWLFLVNLNCHLLLTYIVSWNGISLQRSEMVCLYLTYTCFCLFSYPMLFPLHLVTARAGLSSYDLQTTIPFMSYSVVQMFHPVLKFLIISEKSRPSKAMRSKLLYRILPSLSIY